jgi:hypothetical protein
LKQITSQAPVAAQKDTLGLEDFNKHYMTYLCFKAEHENS